MRIGIGLALTRRGGGERLGPELYVDGTFDDPSKHSVVTETAVSGGRLNYTNTTASRAVAQVPNLLATVGKRYRIVVSVVALTAGNFRFNFGGVTGTVRNAVGTYTQDITAITNGAASAIGLTGSTLSVDNISIKEIL
jgi:hypothetical protein